MTALRTFDIFFRLDVEKPVAMDDGSSKDEMPDKYSVRLSSADGSTRDSSVKGLAMPSGGNAGGGGAGSKSAASAAKRSRFLVSCILKAFLKHF